MLERINNGECSILSSRIATKEDPLTLDEIIAAVNQEDLLCIEIVEEIGQKLGKQIAGLINLFNPELVIIGGTLSLTGDYITQPIKNRCEKIFSESSKQRFGYYNFQTKRQGGYCRGMYACTKQDV